MAKLLLGRSPYPGEFFRGYIMNLAVMNDNMPLEEFESRYLYGYKRKRRSSSGYPESLSHICRRMKKVLFFPDIKEAIKMTPFFVEAKNLTEHKQAKLAESILYDINEEMTPNWRKQNKQELRYCPECQKEDVERYGSWYFHLEHNLPGACVCTKHKYPLMELDQFDKRKSCFPDMSTSKPVIVQDLEEAILQAPKLVEQEILITNVCPECGEEYLIHPYSLETEAGCPFCRGKMNIEEHLSNRIWQVHYDEYFLEKVDKGLNSRALHMSCMVSSRTVDRLLYDEPSECSGCKALTVPKIQKIIDERKEPFLITKEFRSESDAGMISAVHLDCGRSFDMQKTYFLKDPHCPHCEKEMRTESFADLGIPGYSIVSTYNNNREQLMIHHDECGCVFETSKTSIAAGTRCPICTNRYDIEMVSSALDYCCPDYKVKKGKKRGTVDVFRDDMLVYSQIPYSKIMNDLQEEEPELFPERKRKYVPPKSIRRIIYDSVKEAASKKGYWTAVEDGINGKKMTREQRNILQDFANQGFIKRI